jgi:adenylate cyclase
MLDEPGARLYTVASRRYEESGVGAEIPLGQGVIGVAARERTPIRIGHMNAEYSYSRAIRESAAGSDWAGALDTEIPLPGLQESRSQLAVPITATLPASARPVATSVSHIIARRALWTVV